MASVATFGWWIVGYSFGFGPGNAFIGTTNFLLLADVNIHRWIVELGLLLVSLFASVGSFAERASTKVYFVLAIVYATVIYPFVAHCMYYFRL